MTIADRIDANVNTCESDEFIYYDSGEEELDDDHPCPSVKDDRYDDVKSDCHDDVNGHNSCPFVKDDCHDDVMGDCHDDVNGHNSCPFVKDDCHDDVMGDTRHDIIQHTVDLDAIDNICYNTNDDDISSNQPNRHLHPTR